MTLLRLALLSSLFTLVVGVALLATGLQLAADRPAAVAIGVIVLAAATLAAGVGAAVLSRVMVSSVRELARAKDWTESQLSRTMAQLQRDRADMAALFEHMADGVLVLNVDDRVELANPAAARLLGTERLEGRALPGAIRDPDVLEVARAARDGGHVRQLVELLAPSGRRAWLQVVATQLPTQHRILVLLQDVTELRHAEAMRRDFVANVSHDLKTPVASLKALVETLEAGALDDPECGPDFLRRMHVEVDGLAQLVAELLELARIEAGRLDLDLRPCLADELVRDAIDRIRPYAARVGLEVALAETEPELWIQADPRHISQVLSNLLSNAMKFTPPGGRIAAGARHDGSFVELWVSDSGVGIADDELIRVFERFYKTDPSRSGSGTGLGLAICKHVVRAHGGTILAESDGPGRGSTFRFTLPAVKPAQLTPVTVPSGLANHVPA